MKAIDIIIILLMVFLFGASVYFNFIFPKKQDREKLKKENEKKKIA
jgi:flagellar basal body-associated protein FliL